MSSPSPIGTVAEPDLSVAVVQLMKGIVYRETHEAAWQHLQLLAPRVRDYVAVLGLTVIIDEAEGYAFLRSTAGEPTGDESGPTGQQIPRLVVRRSLSFPVSLLLALLRKKLAEFDATESDTRLMVTREQVVEMMRLFLPPGRHETRLIDAVDAHINKVVDLGFLRRVPGSHQVFEVRRVLKAFVDGQWLADLDHRLAEYAASFTESDQTEGSTADVLIRSQEDPR